MKVPNFLIAELDRQIARSEKSLKEKQQRLEQLKAARAQMEPDKPVKYKQKGQSKCT